MKGQKKAATPADGPAGGRLPRDPGRCKERNTVERCVSKLRQFRAVAARSGRRGLMY